MAVPVLVNSIKMAKSYLENVDEKVLGLMNKYWPGALTIVLDCDKKLVHELVREEEAQLVCECPITQICLN